MGAWGDLVKSLLGHDAPVWALVTVLLGGLLIWRGPSYLKTIFDYRVQRRRVRGELYRKLKQFDREIEEKKEKIARKKAVATTKAASSKKGPTKH
jgi:hypothetical protein